MSESNSGPRGTPVPAAAMPPGAVLSGSLADLLEPGVVIELDAAEAEALGAFQETALTEADAWEANADLEPDEAADGP